MVGLEPPIAAAEPCQRTAFLKELVDGMHIMRPVIRMSSKTTAAAPPAITPTGMSEPRPSASSCSGDGGTGAGGQGEACNCEGGEGDGGGGGDGDGSEGGGGAGGGGDGGGGVGGGVGGAIGGGIGGGVGGGVDGGGDRGGGMGGPTIDVTVARADALIPREDARADGSRAEVCACAAACACGEAEEPVLTTVTSAATACTATVGTMALGATPRLLATALVSIVGAARLPPLVALSSRVTVKDALDCSWRAS